MSILWIIRENYLEDIFYEKLNKLKIDDYFGNSKGVLQLFEILNIRAESV